VPHLPAGGEIVLFDRSWYNRAGVEHVMGFCTEEEVEEFFRSVPEFERMLVRSGTILIKYWFSITDDEQQFRFLMRIHDPLKQWKLSPMDVESRRLWEAYTKAKEAMLERTNIPEAPWWIWSKSRRPAFPWSTNPLPLGPLASNEPSPVEGPTRSPDRECGMIGWISIALGHDLCAGECAAHRNQLITLVHFEHTAFS
jgi:Polyphosphate kinase 2 (PPK2)